MVDQARSEGFMEMTRPNDGVPPASHPHQLVGLPYLTNKRECVVQYLD